MRSEGTSEMISRSMICYFVVIIVLKGDFAKRRYKGIKNKGIKKEQIVSIEQIIEYGCKK
jgi:hypothetical protein